MTTLHERHKKFLMEHTGVDRIIEDRGLWGCDKYCFSEFVTSQGGDVAVYRVYGADEKTMKCYIC